MEVALIPIPILTHVSFTGHSVGHSLNLKHFRIPVSSFSSLQQKFIFKEKYIDVIIVDRIGHEPFTKGVCRSYASISPNSGYI